MDNNLCTPKNAAGERLSFRLADGESDKIERGHPWKATLKLNDGRLIDVEGAACNLSECFCDCSLVKGPYKPRRING